MRNRSSQSSIKSGKCFSFYQTSPNQLGNRVMGDVLKIQRQLRLLLYMISLSRNYFAILVKNTKSNNIIVAVIGNVTFELVDVLNRLCHYRKIIVLYWKLDIDDTFKVPSNSDVTYCLLQVLPRNSSQTEISHSK